MKAAGNCGDSCAARYNSFLLIRTVNFKGKDVILVIPEIENIIAVKIAEFSIEPEK